MPLQIPFLFCNPVPSLLRPNLQSGRRVTSPLESVSFASFSTSRDRHVRTGAHAMSERVRVSVRLSSQAPAATPSLLVLKLTRESTVFDVKASLARILDTRPRQDGIVCALGGRVLRDQERLGDLVGSERRDGGGDDDDDEVRSHFLSLSSLRAGTDTLRG